VHPGIETRIDPFGTGLSWASRATLAATQAAVTAKVNFIGPRGVSIIAPV
jgi:hypothetical protein